MKPLHPVTKTRFTVASPVVPGFHRDILYRCYAIWPPSFLGPIECTQSRRLRTIVGDLIPILVPDSKQQPRGPTNHGRSGTERILIENGKPHCTVEYIYR